MAYDPQPVHSMPVVRRSALHIPVKLTSHTTAPVPGPYGVQPTPANRRGYRRLVRTVKGTT